METVLKKITTTARQIPGFAVFRAMLMGLVLVSLSTTLSATPVFTQTPELITGLRSDLDGGTVIADNFTLGSGATIRSVTWRGFYFSSGSPQAVDAFKIDFYADSGGSVGALLGSFNVGGAASRTGTGEFFAGTSEYFEYKADLGAGMALASGAYWATINNNTTIDANDNWYWGIDDIPGNVRTSFNGVGWTSQRGTTYFILDNANLSTATPEPLSLALVGLALAGLGWSRRRK